MDINQLEASFAQNSEALAEQRALAVKAYHEKDFDTYNEARKLVGYHTRLMQAYRTLIQAHDGDV